MFTTAVGDVESVIELDGSVQELRVRDCQSPMSRLALNYLAFTNQAVVGDRVLLNTTATTLGLGTGGYDFVISNLSSRPLSVNTAGHVVKARYLPCQHAVLTLEEQSEYENVWDRSLDGMQVVVAELHSQVALVAAGLTVRGLSCVYIMTDGAAVPMGLSRLVVQLKQAGLLKATITTGQAFGGDYECVTVHSALLASRHIIGAEVAIVCQGPGNVGTGTRYGFSGIEQAGLLDIVAALDGKPVAVARMSGSDQRLRHQGLSHHTRTVLELAHTGCLLPIPEGVEVLNLPQRHEVRVVKTTDEPRLILQRKQVEVTTMGRAYADDPLFFDAAFAAGMVQV